VSRVLDDISALDAASEERVPAAMWRLLRGRTCRIMAHTCRRSGGPIGSPC
jgi:hypothetical protein